ncbi:MAG: metal-dependent transcriptional regulator [bacterium]
MSNEKKLTRSLEKYLFSIFQIIEYKKVARVKDVAKKMKVKSSSVTGALQSLAKRDLVNYVPYDLITLTPQGEKIAEQIYHDHLIIYKFLNKVLCLNEHSSQQVSEDIEYSLSKDVLNRLISFLEFIDCCPRAGEDWLNGFHRHCKHGKKNYTQCKQCLQSCIEKYQKVLLKLETEDINKSKS